MSDTIQLLDIKGICAKLSMAKSTVYRKVSEGVFPAPLSYGAIMRWRESDIDEWIRENFKPIPPKASKSKPKTARP